MKFKVSILIMLITLITIAGNAQTSTTTSTMHYTTVMSCKSTTGYGTTYRDNNSRVPMAPKIAAVATIATIGIYGLATKTRVSPSMVGVGFLYGAYHLRKEYKDDSYIPMILAGIGCFAIQAFVVRVPQKM